MDLNRSQLLPEVLDIDFDEFQLAENGFEERHNLFIAFFGHRYIDFP
ncbi:MAG: hypothetical protein V2I82_06230 [Halieaceae bacterium]|nr:hypothetical protein [Halieaceae bacterium]